MNLILFDLDGTLIEIDSDHAFGDYLVAVGWADGDTFRRRNDAFYEDYQAARLDVDGMRIQSENRGGEYMRGHVSLRFLFRGACQYSRRFAAFCAVGKPCQNTARDKEIRDIDRRHAKKKDPVANKTERDPIKDVSEHAAHECAKDERREEGSGPRAFKEERDGPSERDARNHKREPKRDGEIKADPLVLMKRGTDKSFEKGKGGPFSVHPVEKNLFRVEIQKQTDRPRT
ncbi:MAG: HAD family hydrolase [Patescibacteria group bacterium]